MIRNTIIVLLAALSSHLVQGATPLGTVVVEALEERDATSGDAEHLSKTATNSTLGGYMDAMPNVDSSSYGEGVGRPVVRGMSGYRVKILQNDQEISDLSAMSHDHAVAVAPKASERIELLKGPASLLFAAQAGGVIRLTDSINTSIPSPGFSGKLSGELRGSPSSRNLDAQFIAAKERWGFQLRGLNQNSEDYQVANGEKVSESDVSTQHGQLSLGVELNERAQWHLSSIWLNKGYGIPNNTTAETRIDMAREDISSKLVYVPDIDFMDEFILGYFYSDYLHDETEGGRKDGLFGQKQKKTDLALAWTAADWWGESRLSYAQSNLQVCHEHGACDSFYDAVRTGAQLGESVLLYYQNTGLAYSHGHPMPDTESDTLRLSTLVERDLDLGLELSLGAHVLNRQLQSDPDNIQEQWVYPESLDAAYYRTRNDLSVSMSVGLKRPAEALRWGWEASLSYIERLPSVSELYWNGFHHATDSYVFGDTALDRESSVNLDLDFSYEWQQRRVELSGFYYDFQDYIYQDRGYADDGSPLIDPFHLSEVWLTRQTGAVFLGGGVRYEHSLDLVDWPTTLWVQADYLRAKRSNGEYLPRSSAALRQYWGSLRIRHVVCECQSQASRPSATARPRGGFNPGLHLDVDILPERKPGWA